MKSKYKCTHCCNMYVAPEEIIVNYADMIQTLS
jgi:hypothetical protein